MSNMESKGYQIHEKRIDELLNKAEECLEGISVQLETMDSMSTTEYACWVEYKTCVDYANALIGENKG